MHNSCIQLKNSIGLKLGLRFQKWRLVSNLIMITLNQMQLKMSKDNINEQIKVFATLKEKKRQRIINLFYNQFGGFACISVEPISLMFSFDEDKEMLKQYNIG